MTEELNAAPPVELQVRVISAPDHQHFVEGVSGSFLQTPAWGEVKTDWTHESIGWFDGDDLVGAGLVLYRKTPRIDRYLAYLPEGPVIDWSAYPTRAITSPLLAHLKRHRVFTVKIGLQVITRQWNDETIKQAIKAGVSRLGDVAADDVWHDAIRLGDRLRSLGFHQAAAEAGDFGDLQPRYVFHVPLAGRSNDDVFAGFNQLWRRNVRKAEKAEVLVRQGGYDDLPAFHEIYVATAERDGFRPRPLSYFQGMWDALRREDSDRIRLYLALHHDEVLAATTWVRVGSHVWYSYGASANHKRELRPSNAIQWQMIKDAIDVGAQVYDLRGIADTLDPQHPLFGLIQFKLGTGGYAVEYLGEFDYALSPLAHRAFQFYLSRRSR